MPTPGLLYVNSAITRPDALTPSTFTSWYNEEHIPDIFATSGMKSAYRYKSTTLDDPRPYLAIYPLNDLDFLLTDEFKAIPVHSERFLPANHDGSPGGIFQYADFDTRYYELAETVGDATPGEGGLLYSVCSGTPTTIPALTADPCFRRACHYRLTFARQNRLPSEEKKLPDPPRYCSLYEFTTRPGVGLEDALGGLGAPVEGKEFTLLKAFSAV